MALKYYVLLGEVILTSSNNTIAYDTGGAVATASLTAGSYFLRGDGASDDLLNEVTSELVSASGVSLTSSSLAFDVDAANVASVVTMDFASTLDLDFDDSSNTFDELQIGFVGTQTPEPHTSTLTPSFAWVGDQPPTSDDERNRGVVAQNRALGGQVQTVDRGGPYYDRSLTWAMIDPNRSRATDNTADTAAAFDTFWGNVRDGRRIEVHSVAISSGTTLGALSSSTRLGTYVLGQGDATAKDMVRFDPATALYSWGLDLLGYVA